MLWSTGKHSQAPVGSADRGLLSGHLALVYHPLLDEVKGIETFARNDSRKSCGHRAGDRSVR